ncbi:hypothetical protein Moror_10143 [Moniliophthora roreri MCA 2997]|uniref:Uncharacterized protein n=1 Tax=Moniliophthora roreri (strain MCA 2997) TaxID=1381753 RepID=V2WW24_MONRO|nr:hypothetical protein Moror_10143 [Moniliophthora roreri MCA 2997]
MANPYIAQYTAQSSSSSSYDEIPIINPMPAPNAYEYDVGILAQQSVYIPGAMIDKRGGSGGKVAKGGKRTTVLRKEEGRRKSLGGPDVAGMESFVVQTLCRRSQ